VQAKAADMTSSVGATTEKTTRRRLGVFGIKLSFRCVTVAVTTARPHHRALAALRNTGFRVYAVAI
jgi:hypothetical protein